MSKQDAVVELQKNSGTQFDPEVVKRFLENLDEIEKMGSWPAPAMPPA
jgi:response regulator RpfG family c-di-GMP phosphodiesterase